MLYLEVIILLSNQQLENDNTKINKFINPQISWNDFNKFRIAMLFFTLFISCGKSKNKIEGTWTFINMVENGNEIRSYKQVENQQVQYLDNGEMKFFRDNKRYGLGLCYYKLKGDSLFLTNIEVDNSGKIDTLLNQSAMLSIKNDTMSIKQGIKTAYYKREKK